MSAQTPIGTPNVGAPLPSPTPPKQRRLKVWHWVLIGLGALVLVSAIAMAANGGGNSTNPTTQQPATQAPATQAPATQPPATAVPAQPKVVLQTAGNGTKTTETFAVTGTWEIAYTLQPSDLALLQVYVYSADNNQLVDLAQMTAPGSDKTVMHGSGSYYLKVNAASPWSVTVTDLPD